MKIAMGSDHAGLDLKRQLGKELEAEGHQVIDVGTDSHDSCDYPDFAREVAGMVVRGETDRGVLICGTGIGMCIAANKVPGVRAALCHEPLSARLTRQDNDSNVLTMGGRIIGPAMAREVVKVWLSTPFAGGRHLPRVEKIRALEEAAGGGDGTGVAGF